MSKRLYAALADLSDDELQSGAWQPWRTTRQRAAWLRHTDANTTSEAIDFYEIEEMDRVRLLEAGLIGDPLQPPLRGVEGDDV